MEDDSVKIDRPKTALTKEMTNEIEEVEELSRNTKKLDLTNNKSSKIDIEMSNKIPKLHGMQINNNNNNNNSILNNRASVSINEQNRVPSTNYPMSISKNNSALINNNKTSNAPSDNVRSNNHNNNNISKSKKNNKDSEKKKSDKNKKDKEREKDKERAEKEEKRVRIVEERSPNHFTNNTTTNQNFQNNTNNNTNTIRRRVKFKQPFIEFVNIESYKLYNSLMCFSDPHTEPKPTKCKCSIL